MKANAAAAGMKDGTHQKVIQVHSHSGQQDEPISLPISFVVPIGNCSYSKKMKGIMYNRLQHAGKESEKRAVVKKSRKR